MVEIDWALVNADQTAIHVTYHAACERGLDFGSEQWKGRRCVAAVVFEIARLKREILDEGWCPVGVKDEIAALFADQRWIPAGYDVDEQALAARKVIGCNIWRDQCRVAQLANARRIFIARD